MLAEPTFVFDQSGDKTSPYPAVGLAQFGPLDAESFTPKAPHIAVVVPRQFQGRVETLVESFRNGVRGSSAYACLDTLSKNEQINLAFVFTSAVQEQQTGDNSPYLVSKSTFMSQGIPVQEYQVENITADSTRIPRRLTAEHYRRGGQQPPRHLVQQRHAHLSMLSAWERCAVLPAAHDHDGSGRRHRAADERQQRSDHRMCFPQRGFASFTDNADQVAQPSSPGLVSGQRHKSRRWSGRSASDRDTDVVVRSPARWQAGPRRASPRER